MNLSPDKFDAFLDRVGQDYAWRAATACPCANPASGASKPNCPLCKGVGRQWSAEICGRAGLTNQNAQRIMAAFGAYEAGDAVFTIGCDSPLYAAAPFDRIRALNSFYPFSEVMTHDGTDKFLGTIRCINQVYWLSSDGTTNVGGGIPAVAPDGGLTWASGEPPAGAAYSISGEKYNEYFVFPSLPTERRIGGAALPRKLLCRRFDLFGRR